MDTLFVETIPVQLKLLEKLLGSKKTFASKITAGDLAIATAFNILLALQVHSERPYVWRIFTDPITPIRWQPDALDAFPTLKAFYAHVQVLHSFNQ